MEEDIIVKLIISSYRYRKQKEKKPKIEKQKTELTKKKKESKTQKTIQVKRSAKGILHTSL